MQENYASELSPRRRQIWSSILRCAVAAALIGWLSTSIPISRVASAVVLASSGYLLLALGAVALSMYLEALRTRIIARSQGIVVTTLQMLAVDLGASFYALFLPWGTLSRGAIRVYRLAKFGANVSTAAVVIFRDRLESTAVMGAFGLGFLAYASPSNSGSAAIMMVGAVIVTFIVYLIVFTPIKIPGIVAWGWIPGVQKLDHLRESIERTRTMSILIQLELLAYSFALHLFIVLTFYFLAKSIELDILLVTMGWVRSAVTLITMLPVTIGGIGLREAAMLFFLAPSGVQEVQAVALAFLIFIFVLLIPGLFGGLLEVRLVLRSRTASAHDRISDGSKRNIT
jgi:uncharacterized membrane protein YbhN (UPF0104 family)